MGLRALPMLVGLALLAGCATAPADDPNPRRIDELDARVARIDRILDNQSLIQLAQRVESLQGEVRALNGRIEELQNANEALRKQQRDLYQDLDQRLKAAAAKPAAAPVVPVAPVSGSSVSAPAAAPTGDEQAQYTKAFDTLKAGDYAAAVDAFRQLAAVFPNGALADNTQYWLGEAYYVMRDYDHAAACFETVLQTWPSSRKAPDALLKLGYTQFEQKKTAAAKATLQQVGTRFPGTDAARLAGERLQKMAAEAR